MNKEYDPQGDPPERTASEGCETRLAGAAALLSLLALSVVSAMRGRWRSGEAEWSVRANYPKQSSGR